MRRHGTSKKVRDLRLGDGITAVFAIGVSQELAQQIARRVELRTMGLSPADIVFNRLVQVHANPSRSRAATSRKDVRSTFA